MMKGWLIYLLAEITAGVLIALLLRRFVCLLAYVKGKSMMDTLRDGEVVFALRRRLHGEIRRFDVVLCRYPRRKGLFIKRVVGLPGETVAIEEDGLMVNGNPVAEGEYFVLGDNRPSSKDSRSVGAIPEAAIIAVAKCVVLPVRRIRRLR